MIVQPAVSLDQKEIASTISAENDEEAASFYSNADVFPTQTSQISVEFQSYLIEVVECSEEVVYNFKSNFYKSLNKAMRLIIQEIITPNAP